MRRLICLLLTGIGMLIFAVPVFADNWKLWHLRKYCHRHNPEACRSLADAYYFGHGIEPEPDNAAKYYEKACDFGLAKSCSQLGRILYPKDPNQARIFLEKGKMDDDPGAIRLLTHFYEKGIGGDKDPAGALEGNRRLCSMEGGAPCLKAARLLNNGRAGVVDPVEYPVLLENVCTEKDATGCLELGLFWIEEGQRGIPDPAKAEPYLMRDCETFNGRGCAALADYWRGPVHFPPDPSKADALDRKACQMGRLDRCQNPIPEKPASKSVTRRQRRKLKKSCRKDDASACLDWGLYNLSTNKDKNRPIAESALEHACKKGLPEGCYRLGIFRKSLKPVHAGAAFWKACSSQVDFDNQMRACSEFVTQHSIEPNREQQKQLTAILSNACKPGRDSDTACKTLDLLQLRGQSSQAGSESDVEIRERACRQGSAKVCRELGAQWHKGDHLPASPDQALRFYRLGCRFGDSEACMEAGRMFYSGRWGEQDLDSSKLYFQHACDLGDAKGCDRLKSL